MQDILQKLQKIQEELEESIDNDNQKIIDISYYGKINFNKEQIELLLLEKEVDGEIVKQFITQNKEIIAFVNNENVISMPNSSLEDLREFVSSLKKIIPVSLNKLEQKEQSKEVSNQEKESLEKDDVAKTEENSKYEVNPNDIKIKMQEQIIPGKTFSNLVPEVREKDITQVYVEREDNLGFKFYGINSKGQRVEIESLKNTEGTNPNKEIMEIDESGEVQKNTVNAMLKIVNGENEGKQNEGFTVCLGQYGVPKVQYYRRSQEDNEYESIPVAIEDPREYTDMDVKEFGVKTRNTKVSDDIERAEELMQEDGNTQLENIDDNPYNDEIERLIQEASKRCNVSEEAFIKEYEKADGDTVQEKIDAAEEEINEQFIGNDARKR